MLEAAQGPNAPIVVVDAGVESGSVELVIALYIARLLRQSPAISGSSTVLIYSENN